MLGGMDEEIEALREMFWTSFEGDGIGAGIVWRTGQDLL